MKKRKEKTLVQIILTFVVKATHFLYQSFHSLLLWNVAIVATDQKVKI
jgi:hypothetical protein